MNKKYDVTAFGEALIDFTPISAFDYRANPGGAPFNLAVCAAKGGARVAFVGKVGNDAFGKLLMDTAKDYGVSQNGFVVDTSRATTHAFVTVDTDGENSFVFCREHCADVSIKAEDVNDRVISDSRHFHFGGLSLAAEPCRSALMHALGLAVNAGCTVSFDPNYRPLLWQDQKAFVKACLALPIKPHLLKVSKSEALLLSGCDSLEGAMNFLVGYADLVLITLGADGVLFGRGKTRGRVNGYKANAVDTTGAGDIFLGSFLAGVAHLGKSVGTLTDEDIAFLADKSCAFAAKSTEKTGAIPSIPEISF